MIDLFLLKEELKRDEGFKGEVYLCSAGHQTIGYGHKLAGNPMPEEIAERLLSHDMVEALGQCESFEWFHALDGARQRVIINMVFNIGYNGVSKFEKMIAAIEVNDYSTAADEMVDSKWYDQVGVRATRLTYMMRHAEY